MQSVVRSVGLGVFALRETDACAGLKPVSDICGDVGVSHVAGKFFRVVTHQTLLAVVAERKAVLRFAAGAFEAHIVLLRRSGTVVERLVDVPVGVAYPRPVVKDAVVAHVVFVLVRHQLTVVGVSAAVLCIPCFGIGEDVDIVHAAHGSA